MSLSIAILEPRPGDFERVGQAAPGARLIAVTSQPLAAPSGIAIARIDPRERQPWGLLALEQAPEGTPVLLLHAGESVCLAGDVPAKPMLIPVDLRPGGIGADVLPSPFAPFSGPRRIELQPRVVTGDDVGGWDPDGLPTGIDAVSAVVSVRDGAARWSPPGHYVDLLAALQEPFAPPALRLAAATCFAQRDDVAEARRCREALGTGDIDRFARFHADLAFASAQLRGGDDIAACETLAPWSTEPEAAFVLGALMASAGRFDEAERYLLEAFRTPYPARPLLIAGLTAWAGWFMADSAWQTGLLGEARDWLHRVHEELPDLADRRLNLLEWVSHQGSHLPRPHPLPQPGPFIDAGDYVGAVEAARLADEAEETPFLPRAAALAALGRYREAQDDAWTQLALEPENVDAAYMIGQCALSIGEWDEAVAALNFADSLDVDARAAVRLAAEYLGRNEPAQAEIWSRRALSIEPGTPSARLTLARVMLGYNDAQSAYELLAPLVEEYPADAAARYELAALLVAAGEMALAIAVAEPGIDADQPLPQDAPLLLVLGTALHETGRLTEARIARELAYRLAPRLAPVITEDPAA